MKPYPLYKDYKENPDLANIAKSLTDWTSFYPGNYKESLMKALEVAKSIKDVKTNDTNDQKFIESLYNNITYMIKNAFSHDQTISREAIEKAIDWMDEGNRNNILNAFDKAVSDNRIQVNHQILSKRFNLSKMVESYFYKDNDEIIFSPPFMYRVFSLIDTYNLTPPAKASLMCEEIRYLLEGSNLYSSYYYAPVYTMLYVVGNFAGDRTKLADKIIEFYKKSKYINRGDEISFITDIVSDKEKIDALIKKITEPDEDNLVKLPDYNISYTANQILVYYIYTGKLYSNDGFIQFADIVSHIKTNRPNSLITILNAALYQYIYTNNLKGISLKGIITSYISFNFSAIHIAMLSKYMSELQDFVTHITSFTYDEDKQYRLDKMVKEINDVIKALDQIRIGRGAKMYDRIDREQALAEISMVLEEALNCADVKAFEYKPLTLKIQYAPEIFPYLEYYAYKYPGMIDTSKIKIAAKNIYDMAEDKLFSIGENTHINQEAVQIRREMKNYMNSFNEDVRLLVNQPSIADMADVYAYLVSLKEDTVLLNDLLSYAESKADEYGYSDDDDYDDEPTPEQKKKLIQTADERKQSIMEKIKTGVREIDEKHQSIRAMFNNNAPKVVDAITTMATLGDKAKEGYLRGTVLPRMRRFLELILGAAILVFSPFLFVLYLLVKVATDPNASDKTRDAITDELEAESQIIERKLTDAQNDKDYDREKKLLVLQKHYHREIAKIKTNKSESKKLK